MGAGGWVVMSLLGAAFGREPGSPSPAAPPPQQQIEILVAGNRPERPARPGVAWEYQVRLSGDARPARTLS